jgi:hypothetical protein
MNRIVKWIVPAALAAAPWTAEAQSALFSPSLTNFGQPSSMSPGTNLSPSTLPSSQAAVAPGMNVISPTLGTGATTLPSVSTALPAIGATPTPAIGTPTLPTIGTPILPAIGTPTAPTIGIPPMPPIGQSTSIIGTGAIGTSPTATVGSAPGSLGQTSIGVPTLQPAFSSMSSNPLLNPAMSPSSGALPTTRAGGTSPATGSGSAASTTGSGTGAGSELSCLPEDAICNGTVVLRP